MDRNNSATLLEFISRLTYNIDGLSGKLRLYLSQFLTFHFSKTLSINRIQDIENKRASKRFADAAEIQNAGAALTVEDRCWAVAAIQLVQAEAERVDDRVVSRRLGKLIDELIEQLELGGELEKISAERERIREELHSYESRPVVRIPARIWPLALDFAIRCSLLLYFSLKDLDKSFLTGLNAFLVTTFMMIIVVLYGRRDRKANHTLLESYGGVSKFKIEYRVSAGQYTWLAIFLAISTFISYLLPDQLHAFAFFGLAVYYFVYMRFFRVGRIGENDLVRQLEGASQNTETLDVDENDELIVDLETRLNASTSRLDAYVLESALFGALSFSGFLQIMASDLISFDDLENFAGGIFTTSQAFIHLRWDAVGIGMTGLTNKVSLFCLVSVESLVCSIFFLAVIASRLRFSDVADRVRTAINLAQAFNTKEEALYHESEQTEIRQSRLHALTLRVNRQLSEAGNSLAMVEPVMAYMEYFRNAGILVFLIILISSSLFITSVLGWSFLALIAATYLYFNSKRVNLSLQAGFLRLRVIFLRSAHWFFVGALSPFVVAMILRNSFMVDDTGGMMALGFVLVGLSVFVWLMLASHYDEDFGDIEKKEAGRRGSRWNIVKNIVATMILLYFVALGFKYLHFFGADEMSVISASMISVLMYFTGYYLSKVKWFGLISGALLGTSSVGLLFKTLHLTGADEMLLIGTIGVAVCTAIVWWKRELFHSLLLRFCLVMLFITSTFVTGFFLRLEVAYAHGTVNLAPIMRVIEVHRGDMLAGPKLSGFAPRADRTYVDAAEAIGAAEWYISTYGSTVPYSAVYEGLVRAYNELASDVTWFILHGTISDPDPAYLENALLMVRERDRILALYDFPPNVLYSVDLGLEADILLLLSRQQEAEESLNRLLTKLQLEDQRREVLEKLALIKSDVAVRPL